MRKAQVKWWKFSVEFSADFIYRREHKRIETSRKRTIGSLDANQCISDKVKRKKSLIQTNFSTFLAIRIIRFFCAKRDEGRLMWSMIRRMRHQQITNNRTYSVHIASKYQQRIAHVRLSCTAIGVQAMQFHWYIMEPKSEWCQQRSRQARVQSASTNSCDCKETEAKGRSMKFVCHWRFDAMPFWLTRTTSGSKQQTLQNKPLSSSILCRWNTMSCARLMDSVPHLAQPSNLFAYFHEWWSETNRRRENQKWKIKSSDVNRTSQKSWHRKTATDW